MKVRKHEKATVVTPKSDNIEDLIQKIQADKTLQSENLILEVSHCKLESNDIEYFVSASQSHKENKKSFVVVTDAFSYDEIPEELSVVPTLQEAFDTVEMEEIERDLGF